MHPRRAFQGACCTILALLVHGTAWSGSASHQSVTYEFIRDAFEMRLDPKTEVWSGRSHEVKRFHVDGTRGLERGIFVLLKTPFREVESVRVRIQREGNGWKTVTPDVHEQFPWSDYPGFTDEVLLVHEIRGLRIGDDVETEIVERYKGLWEIPPTSFGGLDPVREQTLEVRVPRTVELAVDVEPGLLGWSPPDQEEGDEKGERILRFTSHDLEGLEALEDRAPQLGELLPLVRVTASRCTKSRGDTVDVRRTWQDFASWYASRVDPVLELDSGQRQWVTQLVSRTSSREERIATIYTHVQHSLRYVAIELGEGSWIPHDVTTTQNRGYGDCKDMSALLVALLRQTGIPASLALVSSRRSGIPLSPQFPYAYQFNHCIAYVPDEQGDYWLDATNGNGIAGEASTFITATPALIVAGDQARLALPAPRDGAANEERQQFTLGLESGGRMPLRFKLEWRGPLGADWRMRLQQADAEEKRRLVHGILAASFTDATAIDLTSVSLSAGNPIIEGRCTVATLWQPGSSSPAIRRGVVPCMWPTVFPARRQPLTVGPARTQRIEVIVQLPSPSTIETTERTREEAFASFHLKQWTESRKICSVRSLSWKTDVVRAADLPTLAAFLSDVGHANDEMVVVR